MSTSAGKYVCRTCKDLADIEWDAKDTESLRTCYLCKKHKFCRLSSLQKTVCRCTCPCRACRAARNARCN